MTQNSAQITENVKLVLVIIDVFLAGKEQVISGRLPTLYAD